MNTTSPAPKSPQQFNFKKKKKKKKKKKNRRRRRRRRKNEKKHPAIQTSHSESACGSERFLFRFPSLFPSSKAVGGGWNSVNHYLVESMPRWRTWWKNNIKEAWLPTRREKKTAVGNTEEEKAQEGEEEGAYFLLILRRLRLLVRTFLLRGKKKKAEGSGGGGGCLIHRGSRGTKKTRKGSEAVRKSAEEKKLENEMARGNDLRPRRRNRWAEGNEGKNTFDFLTGDSRGSD